MTRSAAATFVGSALVVFAAGALAADRGGPDAEGTVGIELRKSFGPARRSAPPSTQPARQELPGGAPPTGVDAALPDGGLRQLEAVGDALGEQVLSSGMLHLPGVGESGAVIDVSKTPVLETAAGRHLIIDRRRTIEPVVAEDIGRRWPAFSVVQPAPGADLRDVIGTVLDAAGYDAVFRATPLVFGQGITMRITPDFVVLRSESDLLDGVTRAISVVGAADAIPGELRALAAEHRVRILELTPDGAPAGVNGADSRLPPAGQVATIEDARLTPIIEKIARALGLSVARGVALPASVGETGITADLGVSGGGVATLVFENADPRSQELVVGRGYMAIWLDSAADLPAAFGALFKRFGIAAIGPTVEFSRRKAPGSAQRFAISVPGWLAQTGGRRTLVTQTALPEPVRLYLTRAGIDILEYRIR